jgi:hypothetical protein
LLPCNWASAKSKHHLVLKNSHGIYAMAKLETPQPGFSPNINNTQVGIEHKNHMDYPPQ